MASRNPQGFTLVELLISILVSGLIVAALYSAYIQQQKIFVSQDRVSEMQQNLRAVLMSLEQNIRLAGCDPTGKAHAGIVEATATRFGFTMDVAGDVINPNAGNGNLCDANEQMTYAFSPADDVNGNGIADGGGADWSTGGTLSRQTTACSGAVSGFQPVADQIAAIEFNYILEDGASTTAPASVNTIRAVQISLLARASSSEQNYLDTATYTTASGVVWSPANDFRHRFVSLTLQCRNMGM